MKSTYSSKTSLTFSNSKFAYKNTLNNFLYFFLKSKYKNKFQKKKKNLNLYYFWRSYERKTEIRYLLNRWSKNFQNLPGRVFWWVIKNVKKWRKSKIKIFQTDRFGVECPIYTYIYTTIAFEVNSWRDEHNPSEI